jgi:hypothetical protein
MKFLMVVACLALLGCDTMVRVVDKSEEQVALSYLPSRHVDAAILAQQACSSYGRRAEFAWETSVDGRVVATWNCQR